MSSVAVDFKLLVQFKKQTNKQKQQLIGGLPVTMITSSSSFPLAEHSSSSAMLDMPSLSRNTPDEDTCKEAHLMKDGIIYNINLIMTWSVRYHFCESDVKPDQQQQQQLGPNLGSKLARSQHRENQCTCL